MNGATENGASPTWLPVDSTFATTAIHSGYKPKDHTFSPVVPAISLSTTFEQDAPSKHRGFDYTRSGNPTRQILEATLAALDKAAFGSVFSSGLAATTNVISMLNSGDHVICMDDVYGGTGRLFRQMVKTANIVTDFVDMTDVDKFKQALNEKTRLVWIETPTNPTLKVVDISAIASLAHAFSQNIIVAVDNTFLTSYFQRPLALGADMVVYSLTKYVNGHSDVLMGAVVTSREDINERLTFLQKSIGAVPSPFDCYLVLRSLRTLHVRMPLHMKNASTVAEFLSAHPKVSKVLHPGLASHPQHELALKQSSGHSGLISFYIKPGSGCPSKFLQNLKVFSLAESLGGYESLAELPFSMTHASVPAELRAQLGITETLVRLSVGLESTEDLVNDLDQALNSC
ncbi:Cystathionine gamma-lyase [Orchesella cincta]|uniref:cystathionine gamma-lyase n=1 Tax=Orchesella cincta TaxID=48709 RepID=A0A1D2MZR4_ORCCI|nr:Cystathionine gamma-lyase [Orchesella cincta]